MNCETKGCRKQAKKNRKICDKCITEKYKKDNPERYAYTVWKNNAKRRGKIFTISFDYFKQFAVNTSYMAGKGITKYSLHIDRIIEELGYIEGNIQALPNIDNVKKYLSYQYDKTGKPENYRIKKSVQIDETDAPF